MSDPEKKSAQTESAASVNLDKGEFGTRVVPPEEGDGAMKSGLPSTLGGNRFDVPFPSREAAKFALAAAACARDLLSTLDAREAYYHSFDYIGKWIARVAAAEALSERRRVALERILAEPYGCRFCHSGTLIVHPTTMKEKYPGLANDPTEHDADCGYALARSALTAEGEGEVS